MKNVKLFLHARQIDGLDFLAVTYGLLRFLRDLVRVNFSCKVSAISPVVLSRWTNTSRLQ